MMEARACFEVAWGDYTFGMQVSLGDEASEVVDREQLEKLINVEKLISAACLDELGVTKDDVRVITPAEYDELYGDDEED